VVLKRILEHLATRDDFRNMFLDEARIVSRIHHDNVVRVNELGEDDGQLYLVMEYLRGESAAGLMRRLVREGETLPLALAAHIVAEAAAGLHAAHELVDEAGEPLGLVHRDASPQNLFITYDGAVRVLDFGIARAAGRFTETEAGQIKGKFAYMSPEQCRGKGLDRRSDVFTLGAVLYELTTARRLFIRDSDMATMRAVCRDPITPPDELVDGYPPSLAAICMRALERARASRQATAEELAGELRSVTRSLSERDPREELAALMRRVFADRVAAKEEMLRRLRAGDDRPDVTEGEVDRAVVIPTVESPVAEGSATPGVSYDEPPPRRARWGVAAALVAAGALAAALIVPRSDPAPPVAAPEAADEVVLTIESEPAGAEVWLDDEAIGRTPLSHRRPAADTTGRLELRREGHVTHTQELAFDVSQRVFVTMTPAAQSSAEPSSAEPSSTEPSSTEPSSTAAPTSAPPARPARPPSPVPAPVPPPPKPKQSGIYKL
jgi:serine/threonine-protein kinase